jgi:hypothetical protein
MAWIKDREMTRREKLANRGLGWSLACRAEAEEDLEQRDDGIGKSSSYAAMLAIQQQLRGGGS